MLHTKSSRCRLGASTSATGEARVRGLYVSSRAHSSDCGRLSPPRAPRENVSKVLATGAPFESGMSGQAAV